MNRVPGMVANRLFVRVHQHLIPIVTKMPGDDAGDLDRARGVGIGGVEDALAREWRDCLDQRGDVAGGGGMVDAGAIASKQDHRSPVEHPPHEKPFARVGCPRTVDL